MYTYRWDDRRHVGLEGYLMLASLDGALDARIRDLFTQIGRRRNQLDEAVLDDHFDVGAIRDRLLDV
jgi:hypothetical protein